jgi:uncharacterized protein YecE (DUF72 family)
MSPLGAAATPTVEVPSRWDDMTRVMVGLPALQGKLTKYAERFDMVELRPLDTPLPKGEKLKRWRAEVAPGFAFSVVLPAAVAGLTPGGPLDQALADTLEAARVLQANALLLATPPSVRPTKQNRERLLKLAERLPANAHVRAWQANGLWDPQEVMELAYQANLVPVFDAAQEPLAPGPIVYTRIRALGHGAMVGAERIMRIAEQLSDRREAYVVADREVAGKLRAGLRQALAQTVTRGRLPALFRPRGSEALLVDDEEQ